MLDHDALKAACAFISAGGSRGTGYLVSPTRLATCEHVVRAVGQDGTADVHLRDVVRTGTVLALDPESDCAVLELSEPVQGVVPLRLGGKVAWKAPWDGFGFPKTAKEAGIPLGGVVMDASGKDDRNTPAMILSSPQVAAGMAAPLHGFSGSPVLVDGTVIGHIKRFVQDPDNPLRPAYGLVYATPSSCVLALMGTAPAVSEVAPPKVLELKDSIPDLAPDAYHVFVSYRSEDRGWARQLVDRLEGEGFKVFLDQKALVPGDQLANSLQNALGRSKAGVVLISRAWLSSPWCQEESNVLLHRAVEDPAFRVVPLRIDDCDIPAMWKGRLYLDFAGKPGPEGEELRKLLYALVNRTVPVADSAESRVVAAETEATDHMLRDIRAAAAAGPRRVLALWERWTDAGMPSDSAGLFVAESLIQLARPDKALQILEGAGEGVRARQLRALALAKTGHTDRAIEILVKLREAGQLDAETGGILGGRYKQVWIKSGNPSFLETAYHAYLETFEKTGDSYPGINAASLALQRNDRVASITLANKVIEVFKDLPESTLDHWNLATLGEAYLLLGNLDHAKEWYAKAVARNPLAQENIAGMRKQARLNLKALGLPTDALDATLSVPRVVAFTGHMVDAPHRPTPRFPPAKVKEVREEIRRHLRGLRAGAGFCSAARGSDLLFLEEVLDMGGHVRVFLPFPIEAFKKTSVGHSWDERFEAAMSHDRVEVTVLSQEVPSEEEQPAAFDACNAEVHRAAIAQAKLLDEAPVLLAVWNGNPGDGKGGTADSVNRWTLEGHDLRIIDLSKL